MWPIKKAWYRTYQAVFRVLVCFLDWSEPERLEGPGAIKRLPELIQSKGVEKVLIVTDKGLMSLHLLDPLFEALTKAGVQYTLYDGTQPNPTFDNIEDARSLYVENNCEAIIAFGGGSSMDCAKVAAARVVRPNTPIPKMRGVLKVLRKLPPFFAVPTTAGTGSETTIAAVVTNPKTHEKYAINDPVLRPKYAVLDPELTVGLPPHITSTTGMDALTHAVEAYIGHSNTRDTEEKAKRAVKMIFENIEKVYQDGKDIEARGEMLLASYYAGVAFTRAYVGYVHAIAHNLGGMYGIAHGLANAIILPHMLRAYGEAAAPKLADLARMAGIAPANAQDSLAAEAFIDWVDRMNATLDIPKYVSGIRRSDIPEMAAHADAEANPLYPVPLLMDRLELERMYEVVAGGMFEGEN